MNAVHIQVSTNHIHFRRYIQKFYPKFKPSDIGHKNNEYRRIYDEYLTKLDVIGLNWELRAAIRDKSSWKIDATRKLVVYYKKEFNEYWTH